MWTEWITPAHDDDPRGSMRRDSGLRLRHAHGGEERHDDPEGAKTDSRHGGDPCGTCSHVEWSRPSSWPTCVAVSPASSRSRYMATWRACATVISRLLPRSTARATP